MVAWRAPRSTTLFGQPTTHTHARARMYAHVLAYMHMRARTNMYNNIASASMVTSMVLAVFNQTCSKPSADP